MQYKAAKNPSRPPAQGGYALVIMLALLIAGSLYAIISQLEPGTRERERRTGTALALQQAREALIAYAVTYRDSQLEGGSKIEGFGYLPCPDMEGDDALGMFGTAAVNCGSAGVASIGLLPVRSLGLPDLRDSDGNCLWYAVSGPHKGSSKTVPFNGDTRGQFEIIDAGGALTLTLAGDEGGAVAIIFAPGVPVSGQDRSALDKPCGTDSTKAAEYLESLGPQFIHGVRKTADGTPTANDQLAWVSARELSLLARKRSDYASYMNTHVTAIWNDLAANLGARLPGTNNTLPTSNPFFVPLPAAPSSNYNFYENWSNQFRYYRCSPLGGYCYTSANGTRCDAMLLMAGSGIDTSAAWSANVAVQEAAGISFGAARDKAPGDPRGSLRRSNLDYFEDQLLFVNAPGSGRYVTNQSYAVSQPSRDLGMCLRFMMQDFQGFTTQQSDPAQPIISLGSPSALPTSTPTQLILGNGAGVEQYGCAWNADSVALGRPVRIYFRTRIIDVGEGFTFTLAGTAGNPNTQMCGGTGSALGYSGTNGITSPIEAPKLALEFDTRASTSSASINDQKDPTYPHAAFVFWAGPQRSDNLDNQHGACNADNSVCNPNIFLSPSNGNLTQEPFHVRLEVQPDGNGSMQLRAYIFAESQMPTNCPLSMLDLSISPSICAAGLLAATLPVTLSQAWLGFTVGQGTGGASTQEIIIDQFVAKSY